MSQIDVQNIANKILPELDEIYKKEFSELTSGRIDEIENRRKQQLLLLDGISLSLRNHLERFTVRLVQEVVDQLDEKNS